MDVRFAHLSDIPACIEIGFLIHRSTGFSRFTYDRTIVEKNLRNLILIGQKRRRSHCFLLVEDDQGRLIGGLIGCIESHFFSSEPVATMIAYGVRPGHRMTGAAVRLMKAFIEWAKRRGAVEVNVGVNSGIDLERTDRFIKKLGFSKMGANYALSLRPIQEKPPALF
jgi:GNAT superfamily N-acetyltransferase